MTDRTWQDRIVGDRMAVDREFSQRVADSDFSSQEWGLIMTATEFRIENAADESEARLVADTSKVEGIAGELDRIRSDVGTMTPGGPAGGPGGDSDDSGFLGTVKDALGLGGGDSGRDPQEVRSKADALTREYAGLLQERLENEGKWEEIRAIAAGEADAEGAAGTDASDEGSDRAAE